MTKSSKVHLFHFPVCPQRLWIQIPNTKLVRISFLTRSRRRSVRIVASLRARRAGFDFRQWQGAFSLLHRLQPALSPTQPCIQWVSGVVSPGVKRPGRREADHSPPSSAEVRKAWSYNSTPPYVFMACYLVKRRGDFTHISVCARFEHFVQKWNKKRHSCADYYWEQFSPMSSSGSSQPRFWTSHSAFTPTPRSLKELAHS